MEPALPLPTPRRTSGVVLILAALTALLSLAAVFRPREPSPFAAGSGFGVGYGAESVMFGAAPRTGASR